MFSKTRKKIVLSIMAVLILLLAATLIAVYGSSYYSVHKQNIEMLERYADIYSLDALPGEGLPSAPPDIGELPETGELPDAPPDESADGNLFQLSDFYSAAISEDGKVLAVDNGRSALYTEEQVIGLANEILAENKTSGHIGHFIYIVQDRDGYTLAAFMDTSLTEDSMRKVLINTVIAGAVAVIILFFAAVYLAKVIIRPLEENDRKQKQFISDAGHELKTPVSVISANSEILSKEIGDNEWLSNIRYENERMGSLVSDLLELSRAENAAYQAEDINLSRLVVREVLPFESVAFEKGLTLNCETEPDIMVKGNSKQLCQLISILTDNAISHSSGGAVSVELVRERRNAVIRVRNCGEEIPEKIRDRMFDRFYRIDEVRGDEGRHYGLGLAIAKAITETHKGRITADCRDGEIIFTVSIPAGN